MITNNLLLQQSEAYQLSMDSKKEKKDLEAVVKPDKFLKADKWRVFHEAMRAYLQNLNGASGVPLVYVICRQATVPPGTVFVNDMERRIASAPLTGAAYTIDNHRVHAIINSLVLEGPGYHYIRGHETS